MLGLKSVVHSRAKVTAGTEEKEAKGKHREQMIWGMELGVIFIRCVFACMYAHHHACAVTVEARRMG